MVETVPADRSPPARSAGDRRLGVAVGGLGAVGMAVARHLDRGVEGLCLSAVSARDVAKAERRMASLGSPVPVLALSELAAHAEIVVECLPARHFRDIAVPALEAGRILVAVSGGALLEHGDLVDLARRRGGRIIVPTGALVGLDAVRAAAEGEIASVTLVTRKPPAALAGAPWVEEHGIRLDGLKAPLKLFEGNVRDGVRGFPANVNVAAALALAGIGPEPTRLQVWADPGISRNTHHIEVVADSARFTMTIENVPTDENPRTGRLTALSVIAVLRSLTAPLRVGS